VDWRDSNKKPVYFVVCVCSLSLGIINYACPNFRTTCEMTLMFTLQHVFELSTLPSIPYNNSCFIIIRQNFFLVSFSSRISKNSRNATCRFSIGRYFSPTYNRLRAWRSKMSPTVVLIGCISLYRRIYVRDVFS